MIKDSDEWFYDSIPLSEDPPNSSKYQSGLPKNPLDSMPIANGSNRYASPERKAELEAEVNPRPEEEMAEWFSDKKENPDESDNIEEEKTMHQKMYEIATSRYNPFSVGGSENCDSDISCEVQKHSPWPGGSENFQ
jgi:hypothetical protein